MNKLAAQEHIEYIMNHFDFLDVAEYMKLVNWVYSDEGVPSLESIKSMARDVLQAAVYGKYSIDGHSLVSCGGFEARIDKWNPSDLYTMSLNFIPFRKIVTF